MPSLAPSTTPQRRGRLATPGAGLHQQRLAQTYRRDPEADGAFWYSVVTTGIYCRPTCGSRPARAENIRFHDTLDEARATGFRACLRCRPEAAAPDRRQREIIEAACRRLSPSGGGLTARQAATASGLSSSYFHRLFRRLTGTTPAAFAETRRKDELERG